MKFNKRKSNVYHSHGILQRGLCVGLQLFLLNYFEHSVMVVDGRFKQLDSGSWTPELYSSFMFSFKLPIEYKRVQSTHY